MTNASGSVPPAASVLQVRVVDAAVAGLPLDRDVGVGGLEARRRILDRVDVQVVAPQHHPNGAGFRSPATASTAGDDQWPKRPRRRANAERPSGLLSHRISLVRARSRSGVRASSWTIPRSMLRSTALFAGLADHEFERDRKVADGDPAPPPPRRHRTRSSRVSTLAARSPACPGSIVESAGTEYRPSSSPSNPITAMSAGTRTPALVQAAQGPEGQEVAWRRTRRPAARPASSNDAMAISPSCRWIRADLDDEVGIERECPRRPVPARSR